MWRGEDDTERDEPDDAIEGGGDAGANLVGGSGDAFKGACREWKLLVISGYNVEATATETVDARCLRLGLTRLTDQQEDSPEKKQKSDKKRPILFWRDPQAERITERSRFLEISRFQRIPARFCESQGRKWRAGFQWDPLARAPASPPDSIESRLVGIRTSEATVPIRLCSNDPDEVSEVPPGGS